MHTDTLVNDQARRSRRSVRRQRRASQAVSTFGGEFGADAQLDVLKSTITYLRNLGPSRATLSEARMYWREATQAWVDGVNRLTLLERKAKIAEGERLIAAASTPMTVPSNPIESAARGGSYIGSSLGSIGGAIAGYHFAKVLGGVLGFFVGGGVGSVIGQGIGWYVGSKMVPAKA